MKLTVFYRPNSEHSRAVEEFVHDFVHGNPQRKIDLIDVDSTEGVAQCELYGILSYPSIVAKRDDGSLVKSWNGSLPLMNELSYYAQPG